VSREFSNLIQYLVYKNFIKALLIVFWTYLTVSAQDKLNTRNSLSPFISPHYGFVMPSSKDIEYLGKSHVQALEMGLEIKTRGAKYWHKAYNFPSFGFTFIGFRLNNPVLGNFYTFVPYQTLNLIKSKKSEFRLRMGFGTGYISNKFDKNTNHRNRLLSSSFGAVMHGGFEYSYNISEFDKISAKLFFTHMSNGSFSMPNYGINIPTISLGYCRYLSNKKPMENYETKITKIKKITFDLSGALGIKEIYPTGGKKHHAYKFSSYLIYRKKYKSGWVFGTDFIRDYSLRAIQIRNNLEHKDINNIALVSGHEMHIGKFSLVTLLGMYVYKPDNPSSNLYQRYALKYYFTDYFYGSISLKSDFAIADNIEWTLGTRF
jgi:hypothetical protein